MFGILILIRVSFFMFWKKNLGKFADFILLATKIEFFEISQAVGVLWLDRGVFVRIIASKQQRVNLPFKLMFGSISSSLLFMSWHSKLLISMRTKTCCGPWLGHLICVKLRSKHSHWLGHVSGGFRGLSSVMSKPASVTSSNKRWYMSIWVFYSLNLFLAFSQGYLEFRTRLSERLQLANNL